MVTLIQQTLDIDSLQKGDFIPSEVIEQVRDVTVGTQAFAFELMRLRTEIEASFLKRTGKRATVKSEGNGLRVLTDSEATEYNAGMVEQGRRRIFTSHARNVDVDENQLTSGEKKEHTRRVEISSAYTQALSKESKKLGLMPHKRSTPGIS